MNIAFAFIAILTVYNIFIKKGKNKIPWFLFGILFFPKTVLVIGEIQFSTIIIYSSIVTLLLENKRKLIEIKYHPLLKVLSFLLVCLLIIGLADSRLGYIQSFVRPIRYFIENFYPIVFTYFYLKERTDFKYVYNSIFIFFFAFGLYGILNYVMKFNPYTYLIAQTYHQVDFGNSYNNTTRFRIGSFAGHPIYYGFLLSTALLSLVFWLSVLQIRKNIFYIYLGLTCILLVNLLMVNSRTPLSVFILGVTTYYIFTTSFTQKIWIGIASASLVILVLTISPNSTVINDTLNTFTTNASQVEGSSIEKRKIQFAASIMTFYKSPIFGNGFYYINENLGYSAREETRQSSSDFEGFESYAHKLLIEQGVCGIIANLALFGSLFLYFLKRLKKSTTLGRRLIVISVSIICSFLIFIFGTGDLGTFPFFMAIMGINIKELKILNDGYEIPLISKRTKRIQQISI